MVTGADPSVPQKIFRCQSLSFGEPGNNTYQYSTTVELDEDILRVYVYPVLGATLVEIGTTVLVSSDYSTLILSCIFLLLLRTGTRTG